MNAGPWPSMEIDMKSPRLRSDGWLVVHPSPCTQTGFTWIACGVAPGPREARLRVERVEALREGDEPRSRVLRERRRIRRGVPRERGAARRAGDDRGEHSLRARRA